MTEVEFASPVRIIVARGPIRNEVIFYSVVFLHIVEQLDDSRVFWLVQVDIRWYDRILGREEELKANWTHSSLQFDRQLASKHDDVIFFLASETNGDDRGFHGIIPSQECIHVIS